MLCCRCCGPSRCRRCAESPNDATHLRGKTLSAPHARGAGDFLRSPGACFPAASSTIVCLLEHIAEHKKSALAYLADACAVPAPVGICHCLRLVRFSNRARAQPAAAHFCKAACGRIHAQWVILAHVHTGCAGQGQHADQVAVLTPCLADGARASSAAQARILERLSQQRRRAGHTLVRMWPGYGCQVLTKAS